MLTNKPIARMELPSASLVVLPITYREDFYTACRKSAEQTVPAGGNFILTHKVDDDPRYTIEVIKFESLQTALGQSQKMLWRMYERFTGTAPVTQIADLLTQALDNVGIYISGTHLLRTRLIYFDPTCEPRKCDRCQRVYTGPSVYCTLECTIADA